MACAFVVQVRGLCLTNLLWASVCISVTKSCSHKAYPITIQHWSLQGGGILIHKLNPQWWAIQEQGVRSNE